MPTITREDLAKTLIRKARDNGGILGLIALIDEAIKQIAAEKQATAYLLQTLGKNAKDVL